MAGTEEFEESEDARNASSSDSEHTGIFSNAGETRPRRRRTPPALGERNALVGLVAQYEHAAALALASLRSESLQRIRLADVEAGQIDDFQLGTSGRVDAYQIKWSLQPGALGFAMIAHDASNRTSYLRQLADAWQSLGRLHKGCRIVVHLVTNETASTAATPRNVMPRPTPDAPGEWSLAAFLREAWEPAAAARTSPPTRGEVPERWRATWSLVHRATGLSADSFSRFLADCEVQLGVAHPEEAMLRRDTSDLERRQWRQDVRSLSNLFMRWVARGRETEMSTDALIAELGWSTRVRPRSEHEFPAPDIPYREIISTVAALEGALSAVSKGYVALLGSPGSGKSTLLTRTLRQLPDRVIRYYAYVPRSANERRGEATNFLHDVTLALHREGLYAGDTLAANEHELLAARFDTQLQRAHSDWVSSGRRTIILIDGLDHIEREQDPSRSLLRDLPAPEAVPEGVILVLGSQTDRLAGLSARIREHLDDQGRRLSIGAIERDDVFAIVDSAVLPSAPTSEERQRVFDLSNGHPLALNYIINRLRRSAGTPIAAVLDQVSPFAETIDEQYAAVWESIRRDIELARLLALLARMRDSARITWIASWAPAAAVHELTEQLAHLFRQERGGNWAFFHNSFRAYVDRKTRNLAALRGDTALFNELASRCAASLGQPEMADELWYAAHAGNYRRVVELSNHEVFRQQLLASRPVELIVEDSELGLKAALTLEDIVATTRQLLLRLAIQQREHYTGLLPIAEVLLELGDVDAALNLVGSGPHLRVTPENAMAFSRRVADFGLADEAAKIFAGAEPLAELRSPREQTGGRDDDDLLIEWVTAAPRFRTLPELLGTIDRVRAKGDTFHVDPSIPSAERGRAADVSATQTLQFRLLRSLANAVDDLGRSVEAEEVVSQLRQRVGIGFGWFWAATDLWRHALASGDKALAKRRFQHLRAALDDMNSTQSDSPSPNRRLELSAQARALLAEGLLRLQSDQEAARSMISEIGQPEPVTSLSAHGAEGFAPFAARYRLNRVLGALGDTRLPETLVPVPLAAPTAQRDRGDYVTAIFECAVIRLARVDAASWSKQLEAEPFRRAIRPIVTVFDSSQVGTGAYVAMAARPEFFALLVDVAERHGPPCIQVLCEELELEWSTETRIAVWPPETIRAILRALASKGASSPWIARWLEHIEPTTFAGHELESELPNGVAQVRAWLEIGNPSAARRSLELVLSATFGNEHKDEQLVGCIHWARQANAADPANAHARLALLAAAVSSLEGSEAQGYSDGPLLTAAAESGISMGIALMRWYFERGIQGWLGSIVEIIGSGVRSAPAASGALIDLYANLVLPFAKQVHLDLVRDLVGACGPEERARFASAIETVAIGSSRAALRSAMSSDRLPDDNDENSDEMRLDKAYATSFTGLSLNAAQLRDRIQTVADVQDLVSRLRSDSYPFRWEPLLTRLVDSDITDSELLRLSDSLPVSHKTWRMHARIAERLVEMKSPSSITVAKRVVSASSESGWSERYDGGSRLRGYELVLAASGEAARATVWNDLRNAVADDLASARSLWANWERVAPLLSARVDRVAIWEIVAEHVEVMVRHAPIHSYPVLPHATRPNDEEIVTSSITALAADLLDHPGRALANGARRFFVDRLKSEDHRAQRALLGLLNPDRHSVGTALLILRALQIISPAKVGFADGTLKALVPSNDYVAHRDAQELRAHRGLGEPDSAKLPLLRTPLSPILQIVYPPARLRTAGELGPGEMLPAAADAADLVRLYRGELRIIASMAELQPEAVYEYVAHLAAKEQGNPRLVDEEPQTREEMASMHLEIPYIRPRSRRIAQAMSEAVVILLDRGWLSEEHIEGLDVILRRADPWFLAHRPWPRPAVISGLMRDAQHYSVPDDWHLSLSLADAATGKVDQEGWTILAEESWFEFLDWELPVETRVGAAFQSDPAPQSETPVPADHESPDAETRSAEAMEEATASIGQHSVAEYTELNGESMAIVRSATFRLETPNTFWLALHPDLARFLGWTIADGGGFTWVDSQGAVMVESIWWEDGFADRRPPESDDQVAYGWLVRASPSGLRRLREALGSIAFFRRVERSSAKGPLAATASIVPA